MALIKNYPNLYYSVDNPLPFYGFKKEHEGKAVPVSETLPYVRENYISFFDEEVARWKRRIEEYPDRFLGGGSDRWHRPQFEQAVGALMNEFARSFIAKLAPSVQEKFAYKNAEKLLERK